MAGHTRLYRRGAKYYHRAAIPVDIQDTYPKKEETFTLGTSDYQEALKLVRVAAVKVDRLFSEHRRQLRQATEPALKELSDSQIQTIAEMYYAFRLEEDEETRLEGFYEYGEVQPIDPVPAFEEYAGLNSVIEEETREAYARAKKGGVFRAEAEEILSWRNVNLKLAPESTSWAKLERRLQEAAIKAHEVISERNEGKVVPSPEVSGLEVSESTMPLLSRAMGEWAAEKRRESWVQKTEKEHLTWMLNFIALSGDKQIDAYKKSDAKIFKDTLLRLPANWNKHGSLKGLPIGEAALRSEQLNLSPMSDSNVNKIIGFVGSFWTWAEAHYEFVSSNIFKGLKIPRRKSVREERDPFSTAELQTIFTTPLYVGCKSTRYWKEEGDWVPRSAGIFWLPLISLYSGARLGEIAQLYVDDIREEFGIYFFDINNEGDDKRLKNSNSKRRIPLHEELIAFGLLDHVSAQKKKKEKRLFPDLTMGKDGYYSSPFSKHFRRFLESAGIKVPTNAFHSFRHSFEDACRACGVSKEIMDALQGHGERGMSARYGRGYTLEVLNDAMKDLRYKDLDLSHLRMHRA